MCAYCMLESKNVVSKPAARVIRFVIRLACLRRLGDVRPLARIRLRDGCVAAPVQLLNDLVAHRIREYHDALADQPLLASGAQLRQPYSTQELGAVDVLDSRRPPLLSHVALEEVAQDGLEIGRRLKSKLPSDLFYGIEKSLQRNLRADSRRCQAAAVKSGSGQKCRQKKNIPAYHRHHLLCELRP